MSKPDPQFGVPLSTDEVNPSLEVSAMYGVTPSNQYIPIKVDADGALAFSGTISVGTVDQGNPNTLANAWPVKLSDGTNLLGTSLHPLRIDPTGTTIQPVSGTVAATQSGSWTVALSSGSVEIGTVDQGTPAVIANAWPTKLTDGTNTVVVNMDGSINADISGSGSIPVTIDHNLDSVSIYGTDGSVDRFIKTDVSGNLQVGIVGTPTVSVNNFPATQPVSGTVAATQSGIWSVRNQDGSGNSLSSTGGSLDVNITGGSTSGPTDTDDGAVAAGQLAGLGISLSYGYNGVDWERLESSSNRLLVDGSGVTQPVSGTVTANQGGAWSVGRTWTLSSGTDSISAVQSGTWNINNISGTISLPTGAATSANQTNASQKTQIVDGSGNVIASTSNALNVQVANTVPVSGTITANQGTSPWVVSLASTTITGTVAVTQSTSPWVISGTVTANAGTGTFNIQSNASVNLTQIAGSSVSTAATGIQKVGIADSSGSNITLGQKTMANSVPVVVSSDQSAIPVTLPKSSSAALSNVARSNTSQTFLSSNTSRLGATIYNDASAVLYVKFGTTASDTDFTVRMASQTYYEVPFSYTGRIDGVWASNGAGDARITELT